MIEKSLNMLHYKIDRVVISPNGATSLHLPKISPLFAIHQNKPNANVVTFPLPAGNIQTLQEKTTDHGYDPDGTKLLISRPHNRVDDLPYIFNLQNKPITDFPAHVFGLACSENGKIMAVSVDQSVWIWQQLPEQPNGIGWWIDLTADQRFGININANHYLTQQGRAYHGFMKPRQSFTLHPAIAPTLPSNSAVSYQDLALFDNPDEGKGVVCLTAVLPPSRPFDTLYLFVSICKFKYSYTPTFERAEVMLPIMEGAGGPCIFWSLCCRIAVVAVSRSVVILTRELRVIRIIPIDEIFASKNAMVANVAWSCTGQFFVITSTNGEVCAITRSGKNMHHQMCDLAPFQRGKDVPLMLTGDSKDPSIFVVYTREKFRVLKINTDLIPQTIENLMSLHFPFGDVAELYDPAVASMRECGYTRIENFVRLIYLTDLFRIFPLYSPLRYHLIMIFDEVTTKLLEDGEDLYAFLFARCIFRLTDHKVPIYDIVVERLECGEKQRDQILGWIMRGEGDRKDWVVSLDNNPTTIFYYGMKNDDEERLNMSKPEARRNADLPLITKKIKKLVFEGSYTDLNEIDVDMRVILELMIMLGCIDRAIVVARHKSIASDPLNLFNRIIALFPDSPELIFRALVYCLQLASPDDDQMRANCIKALLNMLKAAVVDSMPTSTRPRLMPLSNLCMIEESLEVIVPRTQEDLKDFAVITALAFCAADYKNIALYINGRSKLIPEKIREPLRELFGLIWFIRWRQTAIKETARVKHANDATLRLLAFPEFVNKKVAMSQINNAGPRAFSPEAYALYVDGSRNFEDDPAFPSYMAECTNRLREGALRDVQEYAIKLGERSPKDLPKSNLLLAVLVSHMVPWLRCGIPRALAKFHCGENIPNELLELEDFTIPALKPKKMVLETKPLVEEHPEEESEDSDIPVMDVPQPLPEEPVDSGSGEFKIDNEPPSSSSISEPPVPKKKKHKPKPKQKVRKPKKSAPEPPRVRLLTLDPNAGQRHQYVPPPPSYQPRPMRFGNVWDIDPNAWQNRPKPQPQAPPPQPQPQEPRYVFVASSKKDTFPQMEEKSTSSLSDFEFTATQHRPMPYADQFPLDEELNKRVAKALGDYDDLPEPGNLGDKPSYRRPPVSLSYQPPDVDIPRIDLNRKQERPKKEDSSMSSGPDWKPTIKNMKGNRIVAVKDDEMKKKKNQLQLREIKPKGNN
ncbi:hypothetical protein TVAG_494290 [Trichomonas vaginalis G3]|uniref:Uncharacterized protein n=1 Tax=Trichomonas vaginalis (strain ATCC PRA-98 / G3) TaxID=412133 RepID=A2DQ60_TRIV3|nr:YVTN repeat-like/Quinoprotein amine dehydrogenase family [Trichomonas vaginalis G3]EAY17487.1 hypothetical protein TVAG_494290 [Trichomonas vaginalis G3]KAI5533593.1 YVTN repeat-like/Quinoprotein amine dehydrogenase family [Trichomonas vaginalis G3]|eukprot:XP_001329622.1 hypothetical protein [Trichomonas vaginalis G3]